MNPTYTCRSAVEQSESVAECCEAETVFLNRFFEQLSRTLSNVQAASGRGYSRWCRAHSGSGAAVSSDQWLWSSSFERTVALNAPERPIGVPKWRPSSPLERPWAPKWHPSSPLERSSGAQVAPERPISAPLGTQVAPKRPIRAPKWLRVRFYVFFRVFESPVASKALSAPNASRRPPERSF